MMKKLTLLFVLALVLLSACGEDFTEMDVGLDGSWIAQNGAELYINGVGFTRTTADGDVQTGTLSAAGGSITFSRIGHTSETKQYTLNFPQLKIGDITYYYNSLSEPIDVAGWWNAYPGRGAALIFYPGKRVKDENQRETPTKEGDFTYYCSVKGRYTISNRNLPNSSRMVLNTTHYHVKEVFALVYNEDMPLDLQELFDLTVLAPPSTFEGLEDWWFTIEEVRSYFEAAADRTQDIVQKNDIYDLLRQFLRYYSMDGTYSYTVVFDPEIPYPYTDMSGVPNKLTITTQWRDVWRFLKWDEKSGM
jgi:hypothetical protein